MVKPYLLNKQAVLPAIIVHYKINSDDLPLCCCVAATLKCVVTIFFVEEMERNGKRMPVLFLKSTVT